MRDYLEMNSASTSSRNMRHAITWNIDNHVQCTLFLASGPIS